MSKDVGRESMVNLSTARKRLCELVRFAENGGEVVIARHGRPVAKLLPIASVKQPLPLKRLAELRRRLLGWNESSSTVLRELRDAE